jgi:hypothetical protein
VLRALERWVARTTGFEVLYHNMLFRSRIMVNEIRANMDSVEIHLLPVYGIEQNWFSLKALQNMWGIVDFADLQLYSQPHEAITLVQIPSHHNKELLVFKSLVRT